METKFTPGPWNVSRKFTVGPISTADDQSSGMQIPIADVYGVNITPDAQLIAAAPQLYECLVDARDFIATTLAKIGDGHRIAEICADFDVALAKARGEPAPTDRSEA